MAAIYGIYMHQDFDLQAMQSLCHTAYVQNYNPNIYLVYMASNH